MTNKKPLRRFEGKTPNGEACTAIASAIEQISASPEIEDWFANYAHNHKKRLAFDFAAITSRLGETDLIVECGAAPFILTQSLTKNGYDVVGLDIEPSRFAKSIELNRLRIEKCDLELEPLPFEDNSVDCVLFNQLFEHLRINLIQTMREILRILKPGGELHLSTPNLMSVSGMIKLFKHQTAFSCENGVYEQYEKLEKIGHMGHVREYTPREVCDFLEKTGYNVQELIFRGTYNNRWKRLILKILPSFRPHFGILATKPTVRNGQ